MKTGKITAKLRDAVPVCLMVNGEEVKRYKNIELPDALKEVEMTDFHFNVHMDGKITFEIHYEEGALPEVFPEARTRVSRAAKAAAQESTEVMAVEATEPEESMDIVREKHFALKPCSTEEAILQMDLLGHSFFLYHSTENDKIQVVYRRADGGYGVLIPEA